MQYMSTSVPGSTCTKYRIVSWRVPKVSAPNTSLAHSLLLCFACRAWLCCLCSACSPSSIHLSRVASSFAREPKSKSLSDGQPADITPHTLVPSPSLFSIFIVSSHGGNNNATPTTTTISIGIGISVSISISIGARSSSASFLQPIILIHPTLFGLLVSTSSRLETPVRLRKRQSDWPLSPPCEPFRTLPPSSPSYYAFL